MQLTVYVSYFVTIAISIHKRAQTMGGNTSGDAQANFIAPDPDFRLRRLLQECYSKHLKRLNGLIIHGYLANILEQSGVMSRTDLVTVHVLPW